MGRVAGVTEVQVAVCAPEEPDAVGDTSPAVTAEGAGLGGGSGRGRLGGLRLSLGLSLRVWRWLVLIITRSLRMLSMVRLVCLLWLEWAVLSALGLRLLRSGRSEMRVPLRRCHLGGGVVSAGIVT